MSNFFFSKRQKKKKKTKIVSLNQWSMVRVTQHDPSDQMITVHRFPERNHSTANLRSANQIATEASIKRQYMQCLVNGFFLVVLRFHGLGFYCDVLLKRRLVICEVDISTISHSPYLSSAQKIFLQCKEDKTKGKCYIVTHFTDS